MPKDKPTYYGESGTIALKGLNPALGFRPQIDVESHLISYNYVNKEDDGNSKGYQTYVKNLKNFLDSSMKRFQLTLFLKLFFT